MNTPTQPLSVVGEPPKQYQIRRELEHVHKTMNELINPPLSTLKISSGKTLAIADSGLVILVDSTAAAVGLSLPLPKDGLNFMIKDSGGLAGTNNITISRNSSDLIDGAVTKVISTNYGTVSLVADGVNWYSI